MYEWLNTYTLMKKRIGYLEFYLEQSEAELDRWVSGDLVNVRLTKGSIACGLERRIEEIKSELSYMKSKMDKLIELIEQFDDVESRLLKMKYIDGMTLESIAEELGYSHGHIKRLHANTMRTIRFIDSLI